MSIQGLTGREHLYARLTCSTQAKIDIENILYYNLSPSTFNHPDFKLLHLEKTPTLAKDNRPGCEVIYSSKKLAGPEWTFADPLLKWEIQAEKGVVNKAAHYWAQLRKFMHSQPAGQMPKSDYKHDDPLGIEITISGRWRADFANIIKPMVDGCIAALGTHGRIEPEAEPVLHRHAGVRRFTTEEIHHFCGSIDSTKFVELRHDNPIIFCERVTATGVIESVIFNPADHLLVKICIKREHNDNKPTFSGGIYTVKPSQ
jgi:hypothetical protein